MVLLLAGVAVTVVTAVVFVLLMPRHGKTHRFVNTPWEFFVGVAFTSAVALGCTMMLSGALNMVGTG